VGPHNIDILSLIYGSLLGDGHLEKRGNSYRLKFTQSNKNVEFLNWFASFFSTRGYSSLAKLKFTRRAPSKYRNKATFEYNFNSYSFSSFKWIYEDFYINGVKIMPTNLNLYFTPLA
jgi:ubiquinol-cytochrome c reductase cytochrome b subunit